METNISKFNEKLTKSYDGNRNKGNIFEVDIEYSKRPHNLHNNLQFLPERMKTKKM